MRTVPASAWASMLSYRSSCPEVMTNSAPSSQTTPFGCSSPVAAQPQDMRLAKVPVEAAGGQPCRTALCSYTAPVLGRHLSQANPEPRHASIIFVSAVFHNTTGAQAVYYPVALELAVRK